MEKYYIVRANGAGVLFGKIKSRAGDEVELEDVRKLWNWHGACAVEQLALEGVKKPRECQFTVTVPKMIIFNALQIIECSTDAIANIKAVPEWKS